MTFWLHILFWLPAALLFHSYVLFPVFLDHLYRRRGRRHMEEEQHPFPKVSVLIPAYNEAGVIEEKIRSVFASDYPAEQLEVLVASDASTDRTDAIVRQLTEEFPALRFFRQENRTGKPGLIDLLAEKAAGEILVLTDANVLLAPDTLRLMTAPFCDPRTGLVDTRLVGTGSDSGIALLEKKYHEREVMIKHKEGAVWGFIMGPSGACYALRRELLTPVPSNFLVDDFYISMQVIRRGHTACVVPEAMVYEDVTEHFREAFRRKVRIAAGNFQNLAHFLPMFRNIFSPLGYCFWSHKGIRWFGPWLLIINLTSNIFLAMFSPLYTFFLGVQAGILLLAAFDALLGIFGKQIVILRFITHFYAMNLALAAGAVKALKGIKTNVWKPTKRNPQHKR